MTLLLISKAAFKLTGHTWAIGYSCSESLASHWNPKSRTSQTKASQTDANGPYQLCDLKPGVQHLWACSTAKVKGWLGGS